MSKAVDWVELKDSETGRVYFANLETNETRWDPPPEFLDKKESEGPQRKASSQPIILQGGWVEYYDEVTMRAYYYQAETRETRWSLPPEYKNMETLPAPEDVTYLDHEDVEDVDAAEDANMVSRRLSQVPAKTSMQEEAQDSQVQKQTPSVSFPEEDEDEEAKKAAAKAKKIAERRLKIITEIYDTETSYVENLAVMNKVYLVPLRLLADSPTPIFQHEDLDHVFCNIDTVLHVNQKLLEELSKEYENFPDAHFGGIFNKLLKNLKGCYTRYINNYDSAETTLKSLPTTGPEKFKYLEVQKSYPDAKGLDLRSFLIMPIQRIPRYRMLIEDLIKHSPEGDEDLPDLNEALGKIKDVAAIINEDKGVTDALTELKEMAKRFASSSGMGKDLPRLNRRFQREGDLIKVRLAHQQTRHVFLFSDLLVYAVPGKDGFQVKGQVSLLGAKVEQVPDTHNLKNAFVLVEASGKGYTWTDPDRILSEGWYRDIKCCIANAKRANNMSSTKSLQGSGHLPTNTPVESEEGGAPQNFHLLDGMESKGQEARIEKLKAGAILMKYNQRDGKSAPRWVRVSSDGKKLEWGDMATKKITSHVDLKDAKYLQHGAKSATFYKQQSAKVDQDFLCFSVIFKGRSVDFAATNAEALTDWYMGLQGLVKSEAQHEVSEEQLRKQVEEMIADA